MFGTITWSGQNNWKITLACLRHSFKKLLFGSPYFISYSNLLHTPAINWRNEGNHEQLFLFGWQPRTKHTELLIASKHICIFIQTRWWSIFCSVYETLFQQISSIQAQFIEGQSLMLLVQIQACSKMPFLYVWLSFAFSASNSKWVFPPFWLVGSYYFVLF